MCSGSQKSPSLHGCSHGFDSDLTIRVALPPHHHPPPTTPPGPRTVWLGAKAPRWTDVIQSTHSLPHWPRIVCSRVTVSPGQQLKDPRYGARVGGEGLCFALSPGQNLNMGLQTEKSCCFFCFFLLDFDSGGLCGNEK